MVKAQLHQYHFDFKQDLKLYLSRFKAKKRQRQKKDFKLHLKSK